MYRNAASRIMNIKGLSGKWYLSSGLASSSYMCSATSVAKPASSGGFFSWITGEKSTILPLGYPLPGGAVAPRLLDYVEPGKTKITTLHNDIMIVSETSSNHVVSIGLYADCEVVKRSDFDQFLHPCGYPSIPFFLPEGDVSSSSEPMLTSQANVST